MEGISVKKSLRKLVIGNFPYLKGKEVNNRVRDIEARLEKETLFGNYSFYKGDNLYFEESEIGVLESLTLPIIEEIQQKISSNTNYLMECAIIEAIEKVYGHVANSEESITELKNFNKNNSTEKIPDKNYYSMTQWAKKLLLKEAKERETELRKMLRE